MTVFLRVLRYLLRCRVRLVAALVCSGLVAAMTGAYAWLVRPVLDGIFIAKDQTLLVILPVLIFGVSVLKAVFNYGQAYLINYVGNRVVTDIREELFSQLMRMPVSYHDDHTSGRLMSHIFNDVSLMANAGAGVLREIFQQGLTCLVLVGVLFYQNWKLAAVTIVVAPLSIYTIVRRGKRLRTLATRGQEKVGDMSSAVQESLAGIRVVKAFGQEDREAERFRRINRSFFGVSMKAIQVSSISASLLELTGVLGVAAIIWYGGYLVISGAMTAGAFFSFMTAMFLAYSPLRRLGTSNNSIQQALAGAERVFAVLDLPNETVQDRGRTKLPVIRRSLDFRGVSFRYEGHDRPALSNVNLTVRAGEVVALVGSSGSGKTTLVSLVPRFYDPTEGAVLLDGRDLRDGTLASLRAQIGIVSQETVLFDDSVKNNIAYGRPDATNDEIEAAARAAYAHEFIRRLPKGYETMIGEDGVKLSGGERQRLAIARAILRDPPIVILDEATSALDSESERIVQMAISNVMKNRTTLVIAHRMSTIQSADRIVVMDQGRIVEIGTHAELLAREGVYHRLHTLQFQDVAR